MVHAENLNTNLKQRREAKQRTQARQLFGEDEMRQPCDAVKGRVYHGAISLRRDRVLHADVVLSRTLSDLVRRSEPLWNSGGRGQAVDDKPM